MLRSILTIVQWASALSIIGLVLLQRGKGADAGAGFGAGASGTVFGARGASTAMSRATAIFAAVFMINSLLLTYTGTRASQVQQKTILDEVAASKKAAPVVGTSVPAPTGSGPASAPAAAPASTPAPASAPK
ncbi:MAG TPA: preprotein translocase subunit SecG [Steroidobacteraceae bacterium]|jgi:preprotein translocase subunit SecG